MDFKELEGKVIKNAKRYCREYDIKLDEDFALLKLYEEVGELAQSILIHRKKCRKEKYISKEESKEELAKEIADILGMLIVVSYVLEIDMEEAIKKKWIDRCKKEEKISGEKMD